MSRDRAERLWDGHRLYDLRAQMPTMARLKVQSRFVERVTHARTIAIWQSMRIPSSLLIGNTDLPVQPIFSLNRR
jgi:hypothetical protein